MDFAKGLADFLQVYGGWGLAVICIIAIIYLYLDRDKKVNALVIYKDGVINQKDELIRKMNEEHHKEIVAVVKECTGVMTSVEEVLNRCERRQEKN